MGTLSLSILSLFILASPPTRPTATLVRRTLFRRPLFLLFAQGCRTPFGFRRAPLRSCRSSFSLRLVRHRTHPEKDAVPRQRTRAGLRGGAGRRQERRGAQHEREHAVRRAEACPDHPVGPAAMSETKWHGLQPDSASVSHRACLGPPQVPASLGLAAASAALAGHTALSFDTTPATAPHHVTTTLLTTARTATVSTVALTPPHYITITHTNSS